MNVQSQNPKRLGTPRWSGLYLVELRSRVAEMNSRRPKLETPGIFSNLSVSDDPSPLARRSAK